MEFHDSPIVDCQATDDPDELEQFIILKCLQETMLFKDLHDFVYRVGVSVSDLIN